MGNGGGDRRRPEKEKTDYRLGGKDIMIVKCGSSYDDYTIDSQSDRLA